MKVGRAIIGVLCSLGASACSNPLTCDASLTRAVQVTVRDQATGALIASETTIIARMNGAIIDSVSTGATDSASPIWVGWTTGRYDLVVRKPGYAELSISDVVVRSDGVCHPSLVRVEAKLTKAM